MNIAFIMQYLTERFGGPVSIVKNVGPVLTGLGHDVSYWATVENRDRKDISLKGSVHMYDPVWPRSWFRSNELAEDLRNEMTSIDILHINGFWGHPVYAASKVARKRNAPYILSPHGCLSPWSLRNTFLKRIKKKLYFDHISVPIMNESVCLHACSLLEAEHFRMVDYKGPITIIPNGVDTNEFSDGDSAEAEVIWPDLKDRPVVLFMSRLSPEKGLDMLIPMWAELIKTASCKDALLVIAGPDVRGYIKVVEALIKKYNIASNILLTGMVQGQEKIALLRRADIFILPSYSENFGIVVAEALSCATPVITTTGAPWKELQDVDAGRWVSPESSELGEAVRELLAMSDSKRKEMGSRGRSLVYKNYSWDSIARKMVTVYNCILDGENIPLHPEPAPVKSQN
jgi:glycosyltransferase involved in cell wall biosynthesis